MGIFYESGKNKATKREEWALSFYAMPKIQFLYKPHRPLRPLGYGKLSSLPMFLGVDKKMQPFYID